MPTNIQLPRPSWAPAATWELGLRLANNLADQAQAPEHIGGFSIPPMIANVWDQMSALSRVFTLTSIYVARRHPEISEEGDSGALDFIFDVAGGLFGPGGSLQQFDVGQLTNDIISSLQLETVIQNVLGDVAGDIGGAAASLIDTADGSLIDFGANASSLIDTLIGGATGTISSAAGDVFRELEVGGRGVLDVIGSVGSNVLDQIGINATSSVNVVEEVVQAMLGALDGSTRDAISEIVDIASAVRGTTEGILSGVASVIDGTFGEIDRSVGESVDAATEALRTSQQEIIEISAEQAEANSKQAEEIRAGIQESIEALTSESEGALRQVAAAEESQAEATLSASQTIEAALAGQNVVTRELFGWMPGLFGKAEDAIEYFSTDQVLERFRETMINTGIPEQNADELISILGGVFEGAPGFMVSLILSTVPLIYIVTLVSKMGEVVTQRDLQQVARAVPSSLPAAGEINELLRRGFLDQDLASELLRLQGFTEPMSQALTGSARTLPSSGIIQTWWLRQFIGTDVAAQKLQELGYDLPDTERFLQMSFFIPPVQDLLTMMVREAFNEEIVQRFGQLQEFPEEFVEFGEQQGISRFWAEKYWASHWQIPSLQMANEMLQRRIIDDETWDVLVRAHDFTPFWRPLLQQVQYRPLTRVDVRRIHDLGLIDDRELISRYQDVGFSRENAEMMAAFTIAYNQDNETTEPEQLERLTRSAVLGLFRDGVITEQAAFELLREIGIGDAAASIFLEAERVDRERAERKEQIDLILDQAQAGILTFEQAQDSLGAAGIEPAELDRALVQLERRRAAATQLPSRSDLDKFLAAKLIDDARYISTMQAHGYSPFWSERYLVLAKGEDNGG